MMRLYSVRGAVCCENTAESVESRVEALFGELLGKNGIVPELIVNVQFTVTSDIDALNPATALRRAKLPADVSAVPLFCASEPSVRGMLPRVIRTMVTYYAEEGSVPCAVYLNGAEALRPDLAGAGRA